jgi:alpha-methylacyl-CoA racemase
MVLADLGAEVTTIDRPGGHPDPWGRSKVLGRGKTVLELDLKTEDHVAALLELVADADALIEGFRPGVAERLGFGPDECLERNPSLVYGRMTGWGQDGPYSGMAGHDINFLAVSGVLHGIGRRGEKPVPPINLLGDFGGGGLLLALGVVCGVLEARAGGRGQVVDAAIVDGSALLASMIYGFLAEGIWRDTRGENLLDGGAPFYDTYVCADGRFVAVGALEPRFYRELLVRLQLVDDPAMQGDHLDRRNWEAIRTRLTEAFAERNRDEWAAFFADTDCCVSPVLSMEEAGADPHNRARVIFSDREGVWQPSPAPRFTTRSR